MNSYNVEVRLDLRQFATIAKFLSSRNIATSSRASVVNAALTILQHYLTVTGLVEPITTYENAAEYVETQGFATLQRDKRMLHVVAKELHTCDADNMAALAAKTTTTEALSPSEEAALDDMLASAAEETLK